MNKLGVYVTAQGFAGIENWNPRVVVSMILDRAFLAPLKARGAFIVGRVFFDDQRIDGDYWADFMLPKIRGLQDVLGCVMAINEPAIWNAEQAVKLCDETARWSARMHAAGFKTGAYSFSEGHPDISLLQYLVGHGCDFYLRHEYDAPDMMRTAGWRCLRYRKERAYFQQPFVISECGIDGGVEGIDKPRRGWKEFGDANHYAQSLRWYRDELMKDDYVIGAAVFAGNWNIGNGTFNIENVEEIRQVVNETVTPVDDMARLLAMGKQQFPDSDLRAVGVVAMCRMAFTEWRTAAMIILAESNGSSWALGKNADGSIDRGLVQFNSKQRSDVSDACAMNAACSVMKMQETRRGWKSWNAWTSYKTGAHLRQADRVDKAAAQLDALDAVGKV